MAAMHLDDELRQLAAQQQNHIGRRQATELGLTGARWRRLAASSAWDPVGPRVLRLRGATPARGEALIAAVFDDDLGAVVSHRTSSWWWGVPGYRARPIELARTAKSSRTSDFAVIHRVRRLDDGWTTILHGVPVVRPELMVLQLCGIEHPQRAARALDNAWNRRLVSGRSLRLLLDVYGDRGRNGTGVLRELLEERGDDYTPPASNLESRVRSILEDAGIRPRLQVDSGGEAWTGRVDFRIDRSPVVLEVQSEMYHSALLDREADATRKAQLERDGFEVVEVTDVEVWTTPEIVVSRVREALRATASTHTASNHTA